MNTIPPAQTLSHLAVVWCIILHTYTRPRFLASVHFRSFSLPSLARRRFLQFSNVRETTVPKGKRAPRLWAGYQEEEPRGLEHLVGAGRGKIGVRVPIRRQTATQAVTECLADNFDGFTTLNMETLICDGISFAGAAFSSQADSQERQGALLRLLFTTAR